MADDVTLRFRLTGEDAGAGRALDDAEGKVSKVGTALKGLAVAGAAAGAGAAGLLAKGFSDNLDIEAGQAKLTAQLGLTGADAEKAGKAAGDVYAQNWGGSMDEVNAAVRAVGTNLGDVGKTSQADIEGMTTKALALASTFGTDVNESTAAAGALMKNGMAKDADEAFDIITRGMQVGGDKAGDFLDTLTEYSPQFDKLGLKGPQVLTILSAGLKAGAKDTDVIADAFKEFSLKAIDGSTATTQAYKDLGLNARTTSADIAAGGDKANAATMNVLQSLNNITDPIKQNQVGVALFGTQWEDTLRQILPAMAGAEKGTEGVKGATDRMTAEIGTTGKARIEGMQRGFELWTQGMASSKGPLGDVTAAVVGFGGPGLAMAGSLGQIAAGAAAMNVGLVASKAAQLASAAASGVATAAQWLWNAALTANPIGLVVVAIAALTAGLVYFFTKTETGRAIFSTAMGGIVSGFVRVRDSGGAALDWLTTKWNKFTDFVTGAPGRISGAASRMWNGFWDGFRATFNKIIGGWNSLHFSIPGFSFAGQNISGFSIGVPGIPYMASGGIVTRPTLLMAGEAGDEAIVPLDRGGFGGPNIIVHVHNAVIGGEDAIQRVVTDAVRRATDRGYGTEFA